MFKKIVLGLLAIVVLVIVGFALFVASRQHLKFDPPYPEITASTDSAVIARGTYIVSAVAPCSSCHGDTARAAEAAAGALVPFSGGYMFDIPPGKFYARNITPDKETGIGDFRDQAVARALRYGVGHDGRALLPFMEMQGLSDEDLRAVVSFLKAQPPVHNLVPAHQYTLLGKIVKATVLANPVGPKETPPATSPHGATVENGRYLVESVALCGSCHTQRNMATGEFTGPRFGGATGFDAMPDHSWSPPNITADEKTGKLARFTEDQFVARIRAGRAIPHSPMPWQTFQHLTEEDIRAIYRYLQTVPKVTNDVGPAYVEVQKK